MHLIFGGTGQTGAYLARSLLKQGQRVTIATREISPKSLWRLRLLGVEDKVSKIAIDFSEESLRKVFKTVKPEVAYNLLGPSSVAQSFKNPQFTEEKIISNARSILEQCLKFSPATRLINATSSDCFGDQPNKLLDESSGFQPLSPYALGKAQAHELFVGYRQRGLIRTSNAILTNHESKLRPRGFVTRDLVAKFDAVKENPAIGIRLGNVDVIRDWAWAPDIADGIAALGCSNLDDDFLFATGKSHSLRELAVAMGRATGVNFEAHYINDPQIRRPSEIPSIHLDPSKSLDILGWKSNTSLLELASYLVTPASP